MHISHLHLALFTARSSDRGKQHSTECTGSGETNTPWGRALSMDALLQCMRRATGALPRSAAWDTHPRISAPTSWACA